MAHLVGILPGPLPAGAARAVHLIPAGRALVCRDAWWRAALAVVEHGRLELVAPTGATLLLAEGAVFTLARLGPATLRNPGPAPAVLVTVHLVRTGETDD